MATLLGALLIATGCTKPPAPPPAAAPPPGAAKPAPVVTPLAVAYPDHWVLYENHAFSFRAPPDLEDMKAHGIDSFAGRFEGERFSIFFDYGMFTDDTFCMHQPDENRTVEEYVISGLPALVGHCRVGEGSSSFKTLINGVNPAEEHGFGRECLGFRVAYFDHTDAGEAKRIALSIRLANKNNALDTTLPVSVADLRQRAVTGELGVPLGTVVPIRAEVVAGRHLRMKLYASSYLLRVTHVDGKLLPAAPILPFRVDGSAPVAADWEGLNVLMTQQSGGIGKRSTGFNVNHEKDYVGASFGLRAYELGSFDGLPETWPDDRFVPASTGFGFVNSLVIVGDEPTG